MSNEPEYNIEKLNLLAFPRDVFPKCEMTGVPATVILKTPHITLYYANEILAEQAFFGIIHKIAPLLAPLLQPPPMIGTREERAKRIQGVNLSKRSLIEFCLAECSNLLSVQKYQLAIPAATQALKFCKDLEGDMSILVVEPYLQLAQASIGLRELGQCEEYLSLAKWIVLNHTGSSEAVKSRLHMLLGRLSTAQGAFESAKSDFASSIYFSSCCYGAESVTTSVGYFRLGDVFLAQGDVESALAFFDKVVDIWYKYLSALHTKISASFSGEATPELPVLAEQLNEEHLADGRVQLQSIVEHRRQLLGLNHIAYGEANYTLGLFEYFLLSNQHAAEEFVSCAHQLYNSQLGELHPSTRHVAGVLQLIREQGDGGGGGLLDGVDR